MWNLCFVSCSGLPPMVILRRKKNNILKKKIFLCFRKMAVFRYLTEIQDSLIWKFMAIQNRSLLRKNKNDAEKSEGTQKPRPISALKFLGIVTQTSAQRKLCLMPGTASRERNVISRGPRPGIRKGHIEQANGTTDSLCGSNIFYLKRVKSSVL